MNSSSNFYSLTSNWFGYCLKFESCMHRINSFQVGNFNLNSSKNADVVVHVWACSVPSWITATVVDCRRSKLTLPWLMLIDWLFAFCWHAARFIVARLVENHQFPLVKHVHHVQQNAHDVVVNVRSFFFSFSCCHKQQQGARTSASQQSSQLTDEPGISPWQHVMNISAAGRQQNNNCGGWTSCQRLCRWKVAFFLLFFK